MAAKDASEILVIDKDWGSTALWSGDGADYTGYKWLDLPKWLVDRFDYWSAWYESYLPERIDEEMDLEAFDAYGVSLAIDLKRIVGDRFVVCYGSKERVVNAVPFSPRCLPPRGETRALSKHRAEE